MRVSCVVFLWFGLLLPAALRAQSAPPPGGYPLREVSVLSRVAEPAIGLIPYRQGQLWGFADSTGRVWIQPGLPTEPSFFARGLASAEQHRQLTERSYRVTEIVLLNARGEFLRLKPERQAAVLRPDSVLEQLDRKAAAGRRAVTGVSFAYGRSQWLTELVDHPAAPAHARQRRPGLYVLHDHTRHWGFIVDRYRLFDARARALNKQEYSSVHLFRGNWALFKSIDYSIADDVSPQQGMVDYRGREVGGRFYRVGDYGLGLAQVMRQHGEGYALMDTTGRFVFGPDPRYTYSVPDSAGLVRRGELKGPDSYPTTYVYLRLDGQPAFSDTLGPLLAAYPFGIEEDRQNLGPDLALARTARGWGVLDRQGRWRVPPRYDRLRQLAEFRRPEAPFVPYEAYYRDPSGTLNENRPFDFSYLLAERAGKVGAVSLRDGREIVPVRYEPARGSSLGPPVTVWPPYRGFAGYRRAGQDYLLNRQGQEIAPGRYQGWEFRVRGQRYFYLEHDKPATEGGRSWTVVDTAGRPLLAPLSRPAILRGVSAAGLVLVQYTDSGSRPGSYAALDARGRPVLRGPADGLSVWRSLFIRLSDSRARTGQLFDDLGRPLPLPQLTQLDSLPRARALLGRFRAASGADSLLVLDRYGRRWATLPATWQPVDWDRQQPNRWRGRLLPVEAEKRRLGYITSTGRRLWAE